MGRLASFGIVGPVLGQGQLGVQRGMPLGRDIGQEDADLAIVFLAQPPAPLAGDPATVGALFGEAGGVEHQNAVGFGQFLGHVPTQFSEDRLIVPGSRADEILEVFAWDADLCGDRLDTFTL